MLEPQTMLSFDSDAKKTHRKRSLCLEKTGQNSSVPGLNFREQATIILVDASLTPF